MSTALASGFLAIEPCLQLLDRGAGQDQRLVAHDVIDVGASGRHQIEVTQVRRRVSEADVERVTVDDQRGLAEAERAELLDERLGLGLGPHVEVVEDDEVAPGGLRRQRHLQAQSADLLVEAEREQASARAMSLAAADEDRGTTIAVTSGTAALLLAELL